MPYYYLYTFLLETKIFHQRGGGVWEDLNTIQYKLEHCDFFDYCAL